MMHISEAATRFPPTEVWESRYPVLMEKVELAPDSCGTGTHRGGLGIDFFFHALEDMQATTTVERTRNAPWGLEGGGEARPNSALLRLPDGSTRPIRKETRLNIPQGATLEYYTGGGGGYGDPNERDPERVHADIREGYLSEAHARKHYPQAFADGKTP